SHKPPGEKKLKSATMPILKVTHFGVQRECQKRGVGVRMLFDLYRRAHLISLEAGCHAVYLQALNDDVAGFYRKYDMKPVGLNNNNLWITINTIKEFNLV